MSKRLAKALGVASIAFAVTYVAFNCVSVISYALRSAHDKEPVPGLVVGVPTGIACSLIALAIYLLWPNRA
jgi:hypothetical protein